MPKTRRAVICILLLCGMLPLFSSVSSAQVPRVKSTYSHQGPQRSKVRRLGQNLPGSSRDVKRTPNGRRRVSAKDTQTATQLPQFFDTPLYPNKPSNTGGAVAADFNGDGKPDLVIGGGLLLGNGDGTFQGPKQIVIPPVGSEVSSTVTGDFNNDGKLDLAAVVPPGVTIQLGNGDGTFEAPLSYTLDGYLGFGAEHLAISDFNGDGKLDLVVVNSFIQNYPYGNVSVLLGNGDGTFQPPQDFPVGSIPVSVAAGDFSGDGKADLAVVGYSNTVYVLLGNGDGTLQPYVAYSVGNAGSGNTGNIAVASLRGNGQLDLVITCTDVSVRVLLGNGDGRFQPSVAYGAVGAIEFLYGGLLSSQTLMVMESSTLPLWTVTGTGQESCLAMETGPSGRNCSSAQEMSPWP